MDPLLYDSTTAIKDFLKASGAKQPVPGGGSIAALAGALSASMGEMVLNYSVGKKDLLEHQDALKEALAEFTRARGMLLELMAEDQLAFQALTAARKVAQGKLDADPAFAAALLSCIRIPQSIGAVAVAILEVAGRVLPICNRWLLSDLAVCAELATATARCASYNVKINLGDVSDPVERNKLSKDADTLVHHAVERVSRLMPEIWKRATC